MFAIKPLAYMTFVLIILAIYVAPSSFAQSGNSNIGPPRPVGPVVQPPSPIPPDPIPFHPARPVPPPPRPPARWHGDYYYNPYTGAISSIFVAGYVMMSLANAQQQQAIMNSPVYYYHPQTGQLSSAPRFGWIEVRKDQVHNTVTTQTVEKVTTDASGTKTTTTTTTTSPVTGLPVSTSYPSNLY